MAGYLTHLMVLIKAEQWLSELIDGLQHRRTTAGTCLTDLEDTLLGLAQNARSLLRVDPAATQRLPATRITNGVGTDLSKYAMIGAIGMDFPINGYVFALNRDWVTRTMRMGAPRRAYVDAGSTDFVLNFINALNDSATGLDAEQQRRMRSYALGHLAGVAADVLLQPAINSWAWADDNTSHVDQHTFKVQLDARVAHGFFQRDHLHEGQQWEDYFIGNRDFRRQTEKLPKVFVKAFTDTYGGTRPTEALCAGTTCRAPEITETFIKDGYANTKGWAIGVGYDQSPWYWYNWMLGTFVVAGGMVGIALIWSSTSSYNRTAWANGSAFGTERFWYDILSNANTWAGVVYYPFTWLAKFPAFWDGIFGPGAIGVTERPAGKAALSISKGIIDVVSFIFDRTMNIAGAAAPTGGFFTSVDPVVQHPATRWVRFGVGQALEVVKTFWIDMESIEQGEEGDRLAFTMYWPVKVATFGTYLVSFLIVFGVKSTRKNADGSVRVESNGFDYLIGLICPALYLIGAWVGHLFDGYVLEKVAGARWPNTDTNHVDRFLPVATNGARHFTADNATGFPVRLFTSDNQGIVTANNLAHYAEAAEASPWGSVRHRDDTARKEKSQPSSHNDYKMSDLIDHAARLAGLLAMAAVNYDASGPRLRDSVKAIFKDWNLDYRTVSEWDALMKESIGIDRGLLPAVAQWADDLKNNRAATDTRVLERIEQDMVVTGISAKILADFSHTRTTPESLAEPFPANARCGRLRRPGAIVLPNLDFDQTIATPLATPLPDRVSVLDALANNSIESDDDRKDLANFTLQRPSQTGSDSLELQLKVNTQDAPRIRIFEASATDSATSWPRRLGANSGGSPNISYTIPNGSTGDLNFCVEALTLAGDPVLSAPTIAPPVGRDGVTPVVPARKPSDIWLEVVHRNGSTELNTLRDVALFTITPWLMFSNLQPMERLYIVYLKEFRDAAGFIHANHSTITDVVDALTAIFGAAEVPVQKRTLASGGFDYVPHQPLPASDANAAKKLYIVDGFQYCNDQWIQDEIEIGYCWAPHAWTPMTIHVPRKRGLEGFVHKELPGPDMAVFNNLNKQRGSINYGGNLEASPPVMQPTGPIAAGPDGLPVPAQEIARFGKLILGEGLVRLTANLGTAIISDLDAGGVITAAVRTELESKGLAATTSDILVATAGSDWRIRFTGSTAPPGITFRVRLQSGNLNVYVSPIGGSDELFFRIDPALVADLDLGGAPNERLQEAFMRGFDLVIRNIVVNLAGSQWILEFEGTSLQLGIELFAGELQILAPSSSGPAVIFIIENDPALIADLDAGGTGTARIRDAMRILFCKVKTQLAIPLPVPRITPRTPGNEWMLTQTGMPGEPMILIRKDGTALRTFEARVAQPAFRTFLEAQSVQPIMTFDTSWLHVGHVDEVMIFVPSNAPKGYKMLMSSTQLATTILTEADSLPAGSVTALFRGKERVLASSTGSVSVVPAEVTVSSLLSTHRTANDDLQIDKLTPIETRLRTGLALDADDIVHLPIYFDLLDIPSGAATGRTSAHFPHPINLQVVSRQNPLGQLERHVIVNRIFGPSARPADALTVLTNAHVNGVTLARLNAMVGHFEWSRKDTPLGGATGLAATFGVTEVNIRNHANNRNKFTPAGLVKNNWDRIWIPEDNVDLLEACVQILLEDIGLTVHWVDDWESYHRQKGEIHCGTNVVRKPPETGLGYTGPYWWDHYNVA